MSEPQSTRASKQAYLTSEILSEGYDPSEFTAYCDQRRGSDIDLWTFEDLIDCVQAFKLVHRPKTVALQRAATETPKSSSLDLREDVYQLPAKRMIISPIAGEAKAQSQVTQ